MTKATTDRTTTTQSMHKLRLHLPRSHLSTTKTYVKPPCVRFFSTKIIYRCNRFLYTQPCTFPLYIPSVHSLCTFPLYIQPTPMNMNPNELLREPEDCMDEFIYVLGEDGYLEPVSIASKAQTEDQPDDIYIDL